MKNKYAIINGEYCEVETTQGITFLIDLEDLERIKDYKWYAYKKRNNGDHYIVAEKTTNGLRVRHNLHRFLMNCVKGDGKIVDHINKNTLDNRKCNLRFATHSENQRNSKVDCRNELGVAGVRKHKQCDRYQARITVNGKEKYLGLFKTLDEAIHARKKAEIKYFGEYRNKTSK